MLSSKLIKCLKKTGSMKLQLKVATTNQAFNKKKPSYYSLPPKKDLPFGTVKNILKQAGL